MTHLTDADLPDGDVTVAVAYSSLNYKDGLTVTGTLPIIQRFPMVCGIDLAGTVEASSTAAFRPGDRVLVNGYGLGETQWGGYTQRQRVVDLDRVERDVMCEVFEDGERPIHDRRIAGRDLQLVHRLVEAGMRVHMRAEPHAERLHEARDLLLRKMLRAIERHVLDEMRQPPLVFVFEHRTRLHHEPKLGPRLRQSILANVVAQAVRQRANRDQRIDRNGLVERRVLKVDGGGWLLGTGKADHRRQCKDRQQQANTSAQRHRGILPLNWRGLHGFRRSTGERSRLNISSGQECRLCLRPALPTRKPVRGNSLRF